MSSEGRVDPKLRPKSSDKARGATSHLSARSDGAVRVGLFICLRVDTILYAQRIPAVFIPLLPLWMPHVSINPIRL